MDCFGLKMRKTSQIIFGRFFAARGAFYRSNLAREQKSLAIPDIAQQVPNFRVINVLPNISKMETIMADQNGSKVLLECWNISTR